LKRRKLYSGHAHKAGLPPGTLVHTGEVPATGKSLISTFIYSPDTWQEEHPQQLEQCLPLQEKAGVTWINVQGIHDIELIKRFGECYGLHPLVLEDIVNPNQRPKIEDYGGYIFIVTRITGLKEQSLESEQISLILGPGYVLSFQEGLDGDLFETVRERIRNGRGRIRTLGPDYLCYALVDAVVDSYFKILEEMGEVVEDLEEELAKEPTQQMLRRIIGLKREIIFMRKGVWPLREVTSELERGESSLISDEARLFFRDTYDHTIHVIDGVETFRDLLSGMLDLYLSSVSNRTNEIMKFLTIVGTIFLPLTFLVGVYGMNFKQMPELEWRYGYYVLWVFMLGISAAMIAFFKKKRWL
jgi:magnesium transporter